MLWLPTELGRVLNHLLGVRDEVAQTDVPQRPEIWDDLCGWYQLPGRLTDVRARLMMGAGVEVFVRGGQLMLRELSPLPALYRDFPLRPDGDNARTSSGSTSPRSDCPRPVSCSVAKPEWARRQFTRIWHRIRSTSDRDVPVHPTVSMISAPLDDDGVATNVPPPHPEPQSHKVGFQLADARPAVNALATLGPLAHGVLRQPKRRGCAPAESGEQPLWSC